MILDALVGYAVLLAHLITSRNEWRSVPLPAEGRQTGVLQIESSYMIVGDSGRQVRLMEIRDPTLRKLNLCMLLEIKKVSGVFRKPTG